MHYRTIFFSVFSLYLKNSNRILSKIQKKCYKEKHAKNIIIFLKRNETKKWEYTHNPFGKLFRENEVSEEEKNEKRQYASNLYNNLSEEKKTKDVNMHMKITETFPKKTKTKSINIFVNDKEIFLKSLNFLWKYFYIF